MDKVDKIVYGLDLSNEVANNNMKILMQELGITEEEIENYDHDEDDEE